MEAAQIRQQFMKIQQCVSDAARVCQSSNTSPEVVRNSLTQLASESNQADQVMQGDDDGQIRDCVDRLEELGDRAMQACRQAGNVDPQLQNAVTQAHDAISSLKHQLH